MQMSGNQQIFFALVRSGLWADVEPTDLRNQGFVAPVNWDEVYQLAEEQSVVGLVTAGIDWYKVHDPQFVVSQEVLLQMIGEVQMIEQTNKAMNLFIEKLVGNMREADVYTLLVKGQGIAQCYERPLWRTSGDVDFFLSEDNYNKAKGLLQPLASSIEPEGKYKKEYSITIKSWVVELHGYMRCGLSPRMDRALDEIQKDVFYGGNVRTWMNGNTQVFLPGVDCDVFFIFTHIIKHYYCGGIGLRQICDWCRLLWTYRDSLNHRLLKSRLQKMGLMSEWIAFGVFAVEYLGMPKGAMPLYTSDKKWLKKAEKICSFIIEVGNFGHNRDVYNCKKASYLLRKMHSLVRRCGDLMRHARIFPIDSIKFMPTIIFQGFVSAVRGE